MKKFFAIVLSLVLAISCLSIASAQGTADDIQVTGQPAQEILVSDPSGELSYNAANQYYIVNGTEAVVRVKLPDYAQLDSTYWQIAYDEWTTHYFTDLTCDEEGYYVINLTIDSIETTGYNMSDFQLYINQDGNQDSHWPDYLINLYADEANLEAWIADFPDVAWEYAVVEPVVTEEPTETEEPIVTENPSATEEPTETAAPTVPATGSIALVGMGISAILAGMGVSLFHKKED